MFFNVRQVNIQRNSKAVETQFSERIVIGIGLILQMQGGRF